MINNKMGQVKRCQTFAWSGQTVFPPPWTLLISASLGLINQIVMAMASSSAMVTTYSGVAQKSVRITESEDGDFLALSLNPLANILVAKLLNPVLTPGN